MFRAEKIILCSGKHYYALHQHRQKLGSNPDQVAIIRIEELCPFPAAQLQLLLSAAKSDVPLVWAQEEPRNMGPWSFVEARFRNILGKQVRVSDKPLHASFKIKCLVKKNCLVGLRIRKVLYCFSTTN